MRRSWGCIHPSAPARQKRPHTLRGRIRCVGVYGRICVGAYTPVPYGRVGLGGGARTGSIYSPTYFPFWSPQAHQAHTLRRSFQNLDYFIPQNTGKSIRPRGYKAGTRLRVPRIPGSLSRFLVCSVGDHSSSRKERSQIRLTFRPIYAIIQQVDGKRGTMYTKTPWRREIEFLDKQCERCGHADARVLKYSKRVPGP